MPIRIYALAKELKFDNKALVDMCTKAGITGKGSALASLSDEEVAKLKAFMASNKGASRGTSSPARQSTAKPSVLKREDYIAPAGVHQGKIPVLPSKTDKPPLLKKMPSTKAAAEKPLETAASLETEPPQSIKPEKKPVSEQIKKGKIGRAGKGSQRRRSKSADVETEKKEGERTVRGIKLAPLPTISKSPTQAGPKEPAPQKPDLKLPKDAIRAGKSGAKPLSEHLRKAEQKRKISSARNKSSKIPSDSEGMPIETPLPVWERRKEKREAVANREEGSPLALGGREARQLKRKKSASARRHRDEEEMEVHSPTITRKKTRIKRTGTNTAAPRKESVVLSMPCTVRGFSEAIGVPARAILGKLLEMGTMSNITATIDLETAELLAAELGVDVKFEQSLDMEEHVISALEAENDPSTLRPRAPIVTFLGH
ncbi:MAG: translation initiation factor IF-2 N-terminal domain-containing protein, partial [Thermoguttaceae bacterium]